VEKDRKEIMEFWRYLNRLKIADDPTGNLTFSPDSEVLTQIHRYEESKPDFSISVLLPWALALLNKSLVV